MPDEVNAKSRHNVWWKCKTCGNEWKSVINARVKGTVCPVCADRAVLAGYNDLATTDRKLLAEWDYEKNSLLPTQVSRKSMKSVWWKCSLGHSWKAKISDRTIIGEKCTVCENEYRSVFPGLAVAYYANQKGLKVQLGSDKLLGIPLETYIPSEKLAIEFTNGSEPVSYTHLEDLNSFSGNSLKYYDSSSKLKTVKLKEDELTVRYNGKLVEKNETVTLTNPTTKQEETFSREEALEQWLTPDTDYTIYGDVKLTDSGDDGTIDMTVSYTHLVSLCLIIYAFSVITFS